jgi:hypothetical protein
VLGLDVLKALAQRPALLPQLMKGLLVEGGHSRMLDGPACEDHSYWADGVQEPLRRLLGSASRLDIPVP